MANSYKKINEVEIVIGVCLAFLVFFLCSIFNLFIVGLAISPLIQGFFTFGTWFFFKSHGDPHADKLGANLIQYFANLLPFIPAIVIAFVVKVIIHNRLSGL